MLAIAKQEFWQLTKNIKSIVMIALLLLASYYFARNGQTFAEIIGMGAENDNALYATGLMMMVLFTGPLFVMALSHDIINREISSRTIRFLLTRTSADRIVWGKFIGVCAFWLFCIVLAVAVIAITSHTFSPLIFATILCLLISEITIAFVVSIVITKPRMSMFIGIVIGIAFPIVSYAVELTDKWWGKLRYVSPMHYIQNDNWEMIALPLVSVVIIFAAVQLFKRGEY
ncbi:ABC transporter permease [Kurthia massiliensis]|uniref:ABC transporter permease n=1 Tax=Kurthia massiliensis TaxID=1033739 RepID=UPI00028973F9|nr:ABC transporter permease subunit [Kurthia massiliensis]